MVQGAGSAGMTSMVSIIITDMVPLHEVATIRSYVNILQTSGRTCGGVIGGALTYSLGWRWAFLVQVPPTLLSILMVHLRLKLPSRQSSGLTQWQKLQRVDFAGAIFLCTTIFMGCFILETGGRQYAWTSPTVIGMAIGFAVALVIFVISANIVAEPIFPLRLLRKWAVLSNYAIALLQVMLQFSLMTIVPLYFQATNRANTAQAGAYLIPAFIGNTVGGLISGYFIKYTGLYKPMTAIAPLFSVLCMCLCYFLWNGHTSVLESMATFPGGMANGMVSSSIFVGLAAGVTEEDMAVAASGLFVFFNLGAVAGASAGAAVYQNSLRTGLATALEGVSDGPEIMRRALSDMSYVQNASDKIRELIVPAYVYSLHQVNCKSNPKQSDTSYADENHSAEYRLRSDLLCYCSLRSAATPQEVEIRNHSLHNARRTCNYRLEALGMGIQKMIVFSLERISRFSNDMSGHVVLWYLARDRRYFQAVNTIR